jgi:hypothetical protein
MRLKAGDKLKRLHVFRVRSSSIVTRGEGFKFGL